MGTIQDTIIMGCYRMPATECHHHCLWRHHHHGLRLEEEGQREEGLKREGENTEEEGTSMGHLQSPNKGEIL